MTPASRRSYALLPLLILVALAPAGTAAQPGVSAQAAALEKVLIGEDSRNADLVREAMAGGAQRRAGIRALGRLEQPELIRWVAPALGDGAGIRAEAAWALAQLARTPESVVQVQALLIERARADAGAGLWEVWGELAAALGRLPYATAEQVARTEAVLVEQLPAPESFAEPETAAIAGAVRGLEALVRSQPQGRAAAGPHVGPTPLVRDRATASGRPALGMDPASGDGGTRHRQRGNALDRRTRARRPRRRSATAGGRRRRRRGRTSTSARHCCNALADKEMHRSGSRRCEHGGAGSRARPVRRSGRR